MYGGGGGDCDTPSLPRDQQNISSQKMLTPNEQRMHHSYFPLSSVSMLHFDVARDTGGWDTFQKMLRGMPGGGMPPGGMPPGFR